MTQENKELLLKDLCCRLPYGVKGYINNRIETLEGINIPDSIVEYGLYCSTDISEFIPYLFPLSSMTEEQKERYGENYDIDLGNSAKNLKDRIDGKETINGYPMYNHIEWLNAHHFDYRGLIEKGLAINATGLNIY